jgi:cystathionine beta-lyase
VQEEVGVHKGYEYSRTQNPTRSALESSLAALENAKFGACFSSGLAAIDCLLKMLEPGDEVISTYDLYGGTYRLFNTVFAKYGIKFHHISLDDPAKVAEIANEKTKMVWIETPTNPMLHIFDIRAISNAVKDFDAMVVVDNTFCTPYIQNPLAMGADVVMHSVTKYIGGHSDVIMGALVTNDEKVASEMYRIQNSSGAVCSPMDAFLVLRGIKTLHLRMERHSENAMAIAKWLRDCPAVGRVYYPGLPDHPGHEMAKKQMRGFSGMISFNLKNDSIKAAHDALAKCKIFTLAESLGGVESLIGHPATMTHASIPEKVRKQSGVVDSLIRLSVGVEDKSDLIKDLERALS